MIKNGLSLSLSTLLLTKYVNHIVVDANAETVPVTKNVLDEMEQNNENQVVIHEARLNVGR